MAQHDFMWENLTTPATLGCIIKKLTCQARDNTLRYSNEMTLNITYQFYVVMSDVWQLGCNIKS